MCPRGRRHAAAASAAAEHAHVAPARARRERPEQPKAAVLGPGTRCRPEAVTAPIRRLHGDRLGRSTDGARAVRAGRRASRCERSARIASTRVAKSVRARRGRFRCSIACSGERDGERCDHCERADQAVFLIFSLRVSVLEKNGSIQDRLLRNQPHSPGGGSVSGAENGCSCQASAPLRRRPGFPRPSRRRRWSRLFRSSFQPQQSGMPTRYSLPRHRREVQHTDDGLLALGVETANASSCSPHRLPPGSGSPADRSRPRKAPGVAR